MAMRVATAGVTLGLLNHAVSFAVPHRYCVKFTGFQRTLGAGWGPRSRNYRPRVLGLLRRKKFTTPKAEPNIEDTDKSSLMQDAGEGQAEAAPVAGNIIRALTGPQVSVALGIGILLGVLANRIATPNLVDSQARTDILGVIASGGLVTNGVYLLDLNIREAEEVTLVGTFVQEYHDGLPPSAQRDLKWLGESLLLVSAATSVLVYSGGQTLARVGVMGRSPVVRDAPILKACVQDGRGGREQYLADLQTLPGKVEFDYLPENCQAVLMLPVMEAFTVVVVGTNRARAFTPKDIVWMKGLSEKAALSLREMEFA